MVAIQSDEGWINLQLYLSAVRAYYDMHISASAVLHLPALCVQSVLLQCLPSASAPASPWSPDTAVHTRSFRL